MADPTNQLAASITHSTTNNANGGVLVPDVVANAIIDLKEQYGVFAGAARRWPMSSDTLRIPRRSSGLTTYYVGESTDITASKMAWNMVQLTARKLAAVAVYPKELGDSATVSIADLLVQDMAYQFAKAEDQAGFTGDGTSTYGGINGITNAIGSAGVKTAVSGNVSFETFDLDDFEATVGLLPLYALQNAKWYISQVGWANSMLRLAMSTGGVTSVEVGGGMRQDMFLGFPVVKTQVLNSTSGSDTSKIKCLFGDLSLSSAYGDRMAFSVEEDRSLYFLSDQVAVKGTQRFDIVNHDVGDSSNAGPVVALKTAAS